MKYYVQFYVKNDVLAEAQTGEKYRELLGSDGVFILDARNNHVTMIEDARKRMEQLRFVQSSIAMFKIMKGNLKHSSTIWTGYKD